MDIINKKYNSLKICLIGPGTKIPPKSWGACEIIVWYYYNCLKDLNIDVQFISNPDNSTVIQFVKINKFDIVHIMFDNLIILAPEIHKYCNKILYTTHWAYLSQIYTNNKMYGPFKNLLKLHKFVNIFAISQDIKDVYIKAGIPQDKIKVIHNGASKDSFLYKEIPLYPEKTIYIGKIEMRKRQYLYTSIPNLYFVGHHHNSSFKSDNYLGSWNKDTLYTNLTDYANLLLMSDGEADPLVIKEALIAGLGIVCNEISSANLDRNKDFITIIPNEKFNDIPFIQQALEENRKISVSRRKEIREYALEQFSWKNIIKNQYLKNIENLFTCNKNSKIGFYFNCYKNRYATDKILENTRRIYPDNPIFLMSDKGDDFSDIAVKYKCKYYYSNINILGGCEFVHNGKKSYRMGFSGEKEAKLYLQYILKAIEYCNTEYLILLEDDVYINDKVKVFPKHAGGDKNSNRFCVLLKKPGDWKIIKKEYPNLKIEYFNLAGGSILHCETIKKCIEKTSFIEITKFDKYYRDKHESWHTNDCILNYLLLINGYTCDCKWTNTSQSNINHPDKRFYNKKISKENGVFRK